MPYLGNSPASNFASVTKDTFSGNASTTAFTLSKTGTTNGVAVFVENVRQIPTTAYAVSGTTLSFTAAPPTGTNNIYVLHHNTPASTATHPASQALTATSGTFTSNVSLGDSDKLRFGASNDLDIYHDGSNSFIEDTGTGDLRAVASTVRILADQINLSNNANTLDGLIMDSAGHITMPKQPCFLVRNSSDQSNIQIVGGAVTIVFDTEVFDRNADFASNTFTAPVTGRYLFTYNINFASVDADHTVMALTLATSNNTFTNNPIITPTGFDSDMSELALGAAIICDMDANDTASVQVVFEGGSAQTDIKANGVRTNFGGVLLC